MSSNEARAGCQLLQPQVRRPRSSTDLVRIHTDDVEQVVAADHDVGCVAGEQITKLAGVRRPDPDADRLGHRGELGARHVGDQTSPPDDDEVLGRERHLAHQVRGHENRASLGCQRLEQVADPQDPLRIEAVHRLVQHHRVRIAEQSGGDAEALCPCRVRSRRCGDRPRRSNPRGRGPRRHGRSRCLWWRRAPTGDRGQGGPGGCPSRRAARRSRGAALGAPRTVCRSPCARPAVGLSSPRIMRIVVDFPAPLGPRKPVTTPGLTVKLRSSTAVWSP